MNSFDLEKEVFGPAFECIGDDDTWVSMLESFRSIKSYQARPLIKNIIVERIEDNLPGVGRND
jgi:hypothetical protein